MTDFQNPSNGQIPSSQPPEPPLRSDAYDDRGHADQYYAPAAAPAAQPAQLYEAGASAERPSERLASQPAEQEPAQRQAWHAENAARESDFGRVDTSGVDVEGQTAELRSHAAPVSAQRTESFAAARMGDTDTMPRVDAGQAEQRPASQGAYAARPAQSAQAYRPAGAAYQPPASAAANHAAPRQKSSAGKTFLFGFLGALVACVLAIGGFAIANGGVGKTQTTSAVIGSTDPTVINAAEEGQSLAEAVAAKVLPSVVAIYNYQDASKLYGYGYGYGYGTQGSDSLVAAGMGSGVVISNDGYIITNYHVVEDAAKLTVDVDGKERDAKYVGGDSSSDIAVIKVEDTEGLDTADIGDSDSLKIGQWVMTVGAPLGLEQSVATGVVSATNRDNVMNSTSSSSGDPYSQLLGYGTSAPEYVYYPNMIQTDAVINPGNSGGALVDANGKLIGINSIITSQTGNYAGVGFAIPVNYAISIAQDIIDGKQPTHAMLGVSLSQVNSTIAQRYNLSADQGAYISAITPDTGAADSDLEVGDIITAIDGQQVKSVTDVTLEIRSHKVGDTVKVTVNRNGETKDVEVKLMSDENFTNSSTEDDNGQGQSQDNGRGNGNGNGGGGIGGYNQEDIQRLLELLGM